MKYKLFQLLFPTYAAQLEFRKNVCEERNHLEAGYHAQANSIISLNKKLAEVGNENSALRSEIRTTKEQLERCQKEVKQAEANRDLSFENLQRQYGITQSWRDLYLGEKAKFESSMEKRLEATELVADVFSVRVTGRSTFRHAPLLQPSKETVRESSQIKRESARDAVKRETKAFFADESHPAVAAFVDQAEAEKTLAEAINAGK